MRTPWLAVDGATASNDSSLYSRNFGTSCMISTPGLAFMKCQEWQSGRCYRLPSPVDPVSTYPITLATATVEATDRARSVALPSEESQRPRNPGGAVELRKA